MRHLGIYLHFNGNCRLALDFYQDLFNGEVKGVMTHADAPFPMPPGTENRIMYSEFVADGISFFASDFMTTAPLAEGQLPAAMTSSLLLTLTDEAEQDRLFNGLADGGNITMPLEDTFWGARFGMVTDRFNIKWMLNKMNRDQVQ